MGYTATMTDNSGREQEQHLAQTATRSKQEFVLRQMIVLPLLADSIPLLLHDKVYRLDYHQV